MSSQSKHASGTGPAEWIAAAISLVIIVGVVGYLAYDAFGSRDSPPAVFVEMDSIVTVRGEHQVFIRATNRGKATAADVVVEGVVGQSPGSEERVQLTLDFIPGLGTRHGGLIFTRDPRREGLRLRAIGYTEP